MRSLLFVPGDSERKLGKALDAGADVLIVDLEDSVAAANKEVARATAAVFLQQRPLAPKVYVRVNDFATGETDRDLAAVMPMMPDGIMLPKCAGGPDVERLSAKLRVFEADCGIEDGATRILPLITETAASVFGTRTYCHHARLSGLTWGAEDLSAAIGASRTRFDDGGYTDVFCLARALTLLAASAAETDAVDTVFPDFRNEAAFRNDCVAGEQDGFTGKLAIHPEQVPIINQIFTPSAEAVERAREIVEAFQQADSAGVVALDGKMYDRPHLRLAERVLTRHASLFASQPSQGPA